VKSAACSFDERNPAGMT